MTAIESQQKRVIVFFDLPTTDKSERKAAAGFRKDLIGNGFFMMQYSVYSRYCSSDAVVQTHIMRLRRYVPAKGSVRVLVITENQYKKMELLVGEISKNELQTAQQLSFL